VRMCLCKCVHVCVGHVHGAHTYTPACPATFPGLRRRLRRRLHLLGSGDASDALRPPQMQPLPEITPLHRRLTRPVKRALQVAGCASTGYDKQLTRAPQTTLCAGQACHSRSSESRIAARKAGCWSRNPLTCPPGTMRSSLPGQCALNACTWSVRVCVCVCERECVCLCVCVCVCVFMCGSGGSGGLRSVAFTGFTSKRPEDPEA
jgi:hypothetical protein